MSTDSSIQAQVALKATVEHAGNHYENPTKEDLRAVFTFFADLLDERLAQTSSESVQERDVRPENPSSGGRHRGGGSNASDNAEEPGWADADFDDAGNPVKRVANVPNCPNCSGPMWDNRGSKKNPKAPDFKCKDKSCTDSKGYVTGVWALPGGEAS